MGTYVENGLFHCTFVKTLTNLTELGPDDGGTVVVAGSHKVKCDRETIIAAAYEDPALIHQVVAPAGSTLLFGEALIHATGQIRSDRERVIVIGGYTPPMFQAWNGQEPSAEFIAQTPEPLKPLIAGSDKWHWQQRHRRLDMPVAFAGRDPARAPIPIIPRRRRRPASRQNGRWRRPVAARTVHWPAPPSRLPRRPRTARPNPRRSPRRRCPYPHHRRRQSRRHHL